MGGVDGAAPRITLAVNADSMSTSLTRVLTELDDVLLDIRIEDQDHSTRLLREGVTYRGGRRRRIQETSRLASSTTRVRMRTTDSV